MCSTSSPQTGSSDMEEYCVRTRLIEKPSVCLYYKGMEDDNTVPFALNAIVGFSPDDCLVLDEKAARSLCDRLNEDRDSLLECGYSEFEIVKKANSV